jgi:hypothetical protein
MIKAQNRMQRLVLDNLRFFHHDTLPLSQENRVGIT